jgi:uncharacterized YigZ family protein
MIVEKQSKFMAYIFPVSDEESIKTRLSELKTLHPKATHHCYAYRLGLNKDNYRANDDGEPSGTAGKPILGQIDAANLTNILIVVVRYYGGTKLGTSGLIQAYKNAAREGIEKAEKVTKETESSISVVCNYTSVNELLNFLKASGVYSWDDSYGENCEIFVKTGISTANKITSWLEKHNFTYTINKEI